LQDPSADEGRWGYQAFAPGSVALTASYHTYPQHQQAIVNQYSGNFIELTGQDSVTIAFSGTTQVKVVNNKAHSGHYQWYSHRGDDTNTSLTHAFNLRGVSAATLRYWTWYDIEPSWDYGYVEISTDNGATWTILSAPHSATDNPSGNAYGPGYSGVSGENGPVWVAESLNLSAYTGQQVLLRFEYVTDDAANRPGWTLDDISIPEIGFNDDVESGPGEWQAQGFVRMDNILPQKFLAQVVEIGDTVSVKPIPLNATNQGQLTINGLGHTLNRAVLIISGLTPITTEPAAYEYSLTTSASH
jgi:immune inhibitor A